MAEKKLYAAKSFKCNGVRLSIGAEVPAIDEQARKHYEQFGMVTDQAPEPPAKKKAPAKKRGPAEKKPAGPAEQKGGE